MTDLLDRLDALCEATHPERAVLEAREMGTDTPLGMMIAISDMAEKTQELLRYVPALIEVARAADMLMAAYEDVGFSENSPLRKALFELWEVGESEDLDSA